MKKIVFRIYLGKTFLVIILKSFRPTLFLWKITNFMKTIFISSFKTASKTKYRFLNSCNSQNCEKYTLFIINNHIETDTKQQDYVSKYQNIISCILHTAYDNKLHVELGQVRVRLRKIRMVHDRLCYAGLG